MKNKIETGVPPYCCCTPEAFAAAEETHRRLRLDPAWIQMAGFRRSALAATFNNAGYIEPLLAIEFKDVIESKGYSPLVTDGSANLGRAKADQEARAKWEEQKREFALKGRPPTLREAADLKSPLDYATWLQTPEGRQALRDGYF